MLSGQALDQTCVHDGRVGESIRREPGYDRQFVAPFGSLHADRDSKRLRFQPNHVFQRTVQGNGAGQTIALIDAYNDPDITADLATFDSHFDLPAPPSFAIEDETGAKPVAEHADRRQQQRLVAGNLAGRRMGPCLGPGRQYLAARSQQHQPDGLVHRGHDRRENAGRRGRVDELWGRRIQSDVNGETSYDSTSPRPQTISAALPRPAEPCLLAE